MTQLLNDRPARLPRSQAFLSPEPLAPLSMAVAVPLGLALTIILPAFVALHEGPGVHDTAYWLQLALACYAGARLTAMILSRGHRLFQGTFWLFCYVALGIAPLAQLVLDRVPTTPLVAGRDHLTLALFLILVGCLAFDLGALLAKYRPSPRRSPPQLTLSRVGLYTLVGLAFVGSGLYIVQLGGIGVFFTTRTELVDNLGEWAQTDSKAATGLLRGFGTVPALLALLFVVRWLVTTTAARRRTGPWLLLLLLAALNVVVNNPITNPRFWFLTAVFALLFVAVPRSIAHYRAILLLGVVAAVLVFPYADHFRYPEAHRPVLNSDSFLEPLTRKDYDQVLMFANALSFAEDGHGHTDGRQVTGALLFFVPRSIWADKPTDTGMMVGEWMGSNNTNLSSPLWMELWLDFGPLGMLAGFIALGYAGERMDRRYVVRVTPGAHNAGAVAAVLFPLIAGYSFILVRGALLQAMTRVGVLVFCLGLITLASSSRHRQLD